MSHKKIISTIFVLLFLQAVQNDLRLVGKSHQNFTDSEADLIFEIEKVIAENNELIAPYSELYVEHNGDPGLIKNYFASQYSLVPKLLSDKKADSSLPKLVLKKSEATASLTLSIIAPN